MKNLKQSKIVKADVSKLSSRAATLEMELLSRVIGQDRAVKQLTMAFEIWNAGLQAPRRPLANLLFLGPTGSGKTRLVEALAEALFGNPDAITKIDCAEFQQEHEISKLIGSPPGYLGFDKNNCRLSKEKLEAHLGSHFCHRLASYCSMKLKRQTLPCTKFFWASWTKAL